MSNDSHTRRAFPWSRHPAFKDKELTLGERAADRVRNGMGSWPFVFGFLGSMAIWAIVNGLIGLGGSNGKKGFDPYPFILLNLFLSMVAGLQGAILLIAAKRADSISSDLAMHTFKNTEADTKLLNENTELTRQVKANTDRLEEIRRNLDALCAMLKLDPDGSALPAE
ncbi:MAG: DUF1003 domain-containing protein [Ilumatobacteraceae bacterium]